jgi:hypothetical protein
MVPPKIRIRSALVASVLLLPASAVAAIHDRVIGVDVAANVPLDGLDRDTSTQFGALIRYEQKLRPNWALTARGGWFRGTRNASGWAQDFFGAWGGGVYRVDGKPDGLFVSGELGFNSISLQVGNTSIQVQGSGYALGGSVGAGYRTGPLTFRGSVVALDLAQAAESTGVMFGAGWDFTGL